MSTERIDLDALIEAVGNPANLDATPEPQQHADPDPEGADVDIESVGPMAPCACDCGCGGDSNVPASVVVSVDAAQWLRCQGCFALGHHPRRPGQARDLAPGQVRVTGARSGQPIVVTKVVQDPGDAARDAEIAAEQLQGHRDQMWERLSRLFPDDAEATLDQATPDQAHAYAVVRKWVTSPDRNRFPTIAFVSPGTGSGKTRLAIATLRAVLEADPTEKAFTAVPWRVLSLAWWGPDGVDRTPGYRALKAAESPVPLVIDDLSHQTMSESQGQGLALLLDKRHRAGHVTIVTANLPYDDPWGAEPFSPPHKPFSRLSKALTVPVRERDLRKEQGAAAAALFAP